MNKYKQIGIILMLPLIFLMLSFFILTIYGLGIDAYSAWRESVHKTEFLRAITMLIAFIIGMYLYGIGDTNGK